ERRALRSERTRGIARSPDEGQGDETAREGDPEDRRAQEIEASRSPRRLPARGRPPGEDERADGDRDVGVEDPPPSRDEQGLQRAAGEAGGLQHGIGGDRREDSGGEETPPR